MTLRRRVAMVLAIVMLGVSGLWLVGSFMVRGQHSEVARAVAPASDVRIRTADHVSIAATFTPGANDHSPAVLLLHGVGASRAATAANAAWLANLGYATLAIDFRGHGQSDLAVRSFGLHEALDAQAAFLWLKRRQHGAPVAVIGISLGGAASLIGEAGPLPADALVLQAVYPDIRHAIRNRIASRASDPVAALLEPFLSFQSLPRFGVWPSRLSPLEALRRYRGPVLVIGGERDQFTPPSEIHAIYAAATGPKTLWLAPVGDHAAVCALTTPGYRSAVLGFLQHTMPLHAARRDSGESRPPRDRGRAKGTGGQDQDHLSKPRAATTPARAASIVAQAGPLKIWENERWSGPPSLPT